MAGAGAGGEGCAQRRVDRPRRHGVWPARLLRQSDRDAELSTAWPRTDCATTVAHDGAVLAHPLLLTRAQPPLLRHGVHYRTSRPAFPATTARIPIREWPAVARCCATTVTALSPSASGTWRPREEPAAGPFDRWPLGRGLRALLRLSGRRHQPVLPGPGVRQPLRRAAEDSRGGLSPDRGPGRQCDPLRRRTTAGQLRRSPSSCTSAPAATHAPHHVPQEWARQVQAARSIDGWDAYREQMFARQK